MHCFQLWWEYNLGIYNLFSTPFLFSIVSDWRRHEGNVDYFLFYAQAPSWCSSRLLREGTMNTTHTGQDQWSRGNGEQKGHEFHSKFSKEFWAFSSRFVEVATFSPSHVLHSWIFWSHVFTKTPSWGRSVVEHTHSIPGWCTILTGQNIAVCQLPRTISAQFSSWSTIQNYKYLLLKLQTITKIIILSDQRVNLTGSSEWTQWIGREFMLKYS